jgi:hypothetical protein
LLAEINRNLVAAGVVGGDDVFVLISEIGRANVSFGKGLAQRAPDLMTWPLPGNDPFPPREREH